MFLQVPDDILDRIPMERVVQAFPRCVNSQALHGSEHGRDRREGVLDIGWWEHCMPPRRRPKGSGKRALTVRPCRHLGVIRYDLGIIASEARRHLNTQSTA